MKIRDKQCGFKQVKMKAEILDTLPINSVVDYDGETVPEGWEQVDDPNTYSTDEVKIGTWIDGKNLYKRTLVYTYSGVTSLNETINPNLSPNIDTVVKFEANFINSTKQNANATGSSFGVWFNSPTILRISSESWDSSKTYIIYIHTYYTKTTN